MVDESAADVQQPGTKLPLKPMHVRGIRVRLQVERRLRDVALLDVALGSSQAECIASGTSRRASTPVSSNNGLA